MAGRCVVFIRLLVLVVVVHFFSGTQPSAFGQSAAKGPRTGAAADKAKKIDEVMSQYHKLRLFNGAVLVAENGKVIFKKGYGLANMEWNIPNAPDTKFRLGSITKQFTAMLVMQMVEKGQLKLDGKLSDYLPYYRKDTGEQVTIHHLLTHTSGIPSYTDRPDLGEWTRDPVKVDEFVKKYCSGDFEFAPGSKYNYNNSGYFLLGAILEQVTGKRYEDLLKEKIFDPLGMKDTGYDHWETILPKRATGYRKTPTDYRIAPYLDMSIPYAAGSLYSTVEDLFLWDQALYTDRLISAESKGKMFTPFLQNYAYGWNVRKMAAGKPGEGTTVIAHGGGINGFNTLITRMVEPRHLIVLLHNTGGGPLGAMTEAIQNILYGRPYEPPKRPLGEALFTVIQEKGIDAAIAQYHEWKKSAPKAFDFAETELNSLGYLLLGQKKIKEAIAIFQLNVEAYPKAFNTYDSLAEAYMEAGEKELAIKNYEKSLELNPKNTNAVERLKKLREE